MDLGVGARLGLEVSMREPARQLDERRDERREVAAPRDRDRDVADRVLEDEVPADDPCDELAERSVAVGVRRACLGDHRCEFGVAEGREGADRTEQHEGDDERRPRTVAQDLARGTHRPRRRSTEGREDPGADHRADREEDQVLGAECPLHPLPVIGSDLSDRLAGPERLHARPSRAAGDTVMDRMLGGRS